MFELVVKNAKIVSPERIYLANIGIQRGKIAAIFQDGEFYAEQIIDAREHLVFPGLIDGHVHFNEPGYTHRETFACGTAAAAAGGVTTIVDMPMLNEPAVTDKEIFERKQQIVSKSAVVDYAFWGGAVNYNLDKLEELADCGAAMYKCFLCRQSYGYTHLTYEEIKKALSITKKFSGIFGFHCEDDLMIEEFTQKALSEGRFGRQDYLDSRPVEAELIAVKKIISIAEELNAPVHICHVSHPLVAEEIKQAKAKRIPITAETCVHYLMFTGQDLIEKGMLFKCSPPLRSEEEKEAMWPYVEDGTFDVLGSDHSPAPAWEKTEEKNGTFGAWGGMSGVQTTLPIFYEQAVNKRGLSPTVVSKLLCQNPAKLYGLNDTKGAIEVGFDADLVIFDPDRQWSITEESLLYKNQISAFTGQTGTGSPILTLLRGKVVAQNGMVTGQNGYGQLLKRSYANGTERENSN